MDFENSTTITVSIEPRDIREVDRGLVVIGRCPELAAHFCSLAKMRFKQPPWLHGLPGEFVHDYRNRLNVLRIPYRPRGQDSNESREADRCQSALEMPLVLAIKHCRPEIVAMVPLSWRRPTVVAQGMVRTLWDISVAAFLSSALLTSSRMPNRFAIYCTDDLAPLEKELSHGHYPSLRHGWLINTTIQCNRAKRLRYLRRQKFRFRRATEAEPRDKTGPSEPPGEGEPWN